MSTNDPVKILLVDGRPAGRLAIEAALSELDASLICASSVEEVLRGATEADLAAILLDVETHGRSGLDLARLLRDRNRHTPILFLGAGDDFPVEEANALGAVDHLPGPLAPVVLRTKIASHIEQFRRKRGASAEPPRDRAATPGQDGLWRTILASIGDAVIATDADGRVTFLNPVAERLTGWSLADARGMPLTEVFRIVNETTREPVENPALRALETGVIVGLANHTILIARDGTERPIDDSAAPIRDDAGTVSGAVLVFRDISERRKAEEALRESEARHRILADLADATQPSTDPGAIMTAAARLLAEHLGADRVAYAEVEDGSVYVINGDYTRGVPSIVGRWPIAAFGAEHLRMMRANEPYVVEDADTDPRIAPDDLPAYRATDIRAVVCVPLSKGGRLTAAMAVHQKSPRRWTPAEVRLVRTVVARCWETLERAAAERALDESRARLDYAVQASGIGFWYCDLPFDVLQWDARVKSHFWLPPDARVTLGTFFDRIHPDDREPTRAAIERSIAGREGYDVQFRTIDPAGGAERWVRAIGRASYGEAGDPIRFDGVTQDVTEQRRAEAALRESNDRFTIVARATNDAVWDWDMRTNSVWWNEGVTTLFGHRREDAGPDATWWYEHIHPEDREGVVTSIHAVIDHGGSNWSGEYRFLRADGGYATILDRGYAIHEGGRTIRLVGAMQDVTERRLAEERLRESEQRFRSLFESMDEGYCVVEPMLDDAGRPFDYRYLMANPALEEQTGMADIVGKTAREVMPHHESDWIEAYARVAETGERVRRTDRVADLDRWFDVSAFPVGPPGSRRVGVLFNDISDRKRAEALLREKDERLKLLVERARDYAVVVTDRDGRVVEWSGGAESITGITLEEILGQPADRIFTPEDRAAGVPAMEMEKAAREGRAEDKRWHVRQDGGQFFADGVMVPLWGDDDTLHGFGKVFRDVTARKRAEESVRFLADSSASLAELVDYQSTLNRIANLAVGGFADWCVIDLIAEGGRRERLAVTAAESEVEADARDADAAHRPADVAAGVVPHVLRTGEPEVVFDLAEADPATAPQGADRLARLRGLGIRSYLCVPLLSRGRVIGGMTFLSSSARRRFGPAELQVAQNLAERVTAAIENAQLYRTLQEQDRRKDEFLATLAHELRNPLAPIRNGLQILRMDGDTAEVAGETLSMMDRQLRHITHLVDDLMDVARVSSGKVALRLERVPLRAIVDAAVETNRQSIEEAGHELGLRIPREPLVVEGDRTRLVQVLANLLNNAAKYTPQGGRISLGVARDDGHAVIKVADTGVGIPPEMLPKVFGMFTQVGTSLERSQGGLGIGLTLVKRLVEMHGGTVAAESPGPGQGSTFIVRIPLAAEAAALADIPPVAAAAPAGHRPDILVVDDNRDSAVTLARLLKMRGHRVKVAHDGPEALRLLATYRPQLILLDLGLPGMSGYEVARRIRESTELVGVTLAALTGWGQEEDRRRTREVGFDHHLVKPADPDEIERIADSILPEG
ncbi:PAS domain S-box protein [Tautonia plasticadhaerens]|uniref:histidine kinase n=1 Tax=Tautonia plasticadhaerens TaxID=2527974 RepID=A0A518HAB6_9BACT|nr:PAS domain S-box protein [Tautonia plasticadhaerens]QDV37747.1 Sensor histidine kinase TmoS [Tautonia plasticadhaerens]